MKRILLFTATNLAVITVLAVLGSLLGLDQWLARRGIPWQMLLGFALLMGFGGAFISLAISKWMAIHAYGIQVIRQPSDATERWLFETVQELAARAGIGMPDVGIYESPEANAFATGMRRDKALVAVSSGLLRQMNSTEVEGVLAHEVGHITNGDMVTMTLLQGVLNTFVIFLSRIVGYVIDMALRRGDDDRGPGIGYFIGYMISSILFSLLAMLIVMGYSRRREFRADALGARLAGRPGMVGALRRLQQIQDGGGVLDNRAASLSALKISNVSGRKGLLALFASHPPLEDRIAALERLT